MSRPSKAVESSHPRRELLGAPDWEGTTDFARLRDSMTAVMDRRAFVSYGQDIAGFHRRAATYGDQDPQGRPLVINLKTAKALGLTIPPTLLQRADQLIES